MECNSVTSSPRNKNKPYYSNIKPYSCILNFVYLVKNSAINRCISTKSRVRNLTKIVIEIIISKKANVRIDVIIHEAYTEHMTTMTKEKFRGSYDTPHIFNNYLSQSIERFEDVKIIQPYRFLFFLFCYFCSSLLMSFYVMQY